MGKPINRTHKTHSHTHTLTRVHTHTHNSISLGIEIEDEHHAVKRVEYHRKTVSIEYLKKWFWLDLVSAFPFELVTNDDSGNIPQVLKVFKLSRLLRLLRLVRIARMLRILQRLEYSLRIQEGLRQLFAFLAVLVYAAHWFSCCFFALGDMARSDDEFWANGVGLDGFGIGTNYLAAVYWSIMTLTTVGYGDVSAINNQQRLLGIFAMICGALLFSYGVSHVVNIVDDLRADTKEFKQRMDKFEHYMSHRNLPRTLRGDIREFLYNIRRAQKSTIRDEEELVSQLSMGLRSRVAMAVNEVYLKEMPFFVGAEPELTMELALRMQSIYYSPQEDVVTEGEEGEAMYFIVSGQVEVVAGPQQVRVAVLVEKQYFGESALLKPPGQRVRNATVRCISFCELRLLKAYDFAEILGKFPLTRRQISQLSDARTRALHHKKGDDLAVNFEDSASGGPLQKQYSSKKLAAAFKDDDMQQHPPTLITAAAGLSREQLSDTFKPDDELAQQRESRDDADPDETLSMVCEQIGMLHASVNALAEQVSSMLTDTRELGK